MKIYGLVIYRYHDLLKRHVIDEVRVFESEERRDDLDHEMLMKGRNYETFEAEVGLGHLDAADSMAEMSERYVKKLFGYGFPVVTSDDVLKAIENYRRSRR